MARIHKRSACRLCNSSRIICVFKLESTPIGDAYSSSEETARSLETFPVEMNLCMHCGLAQLVHIISPDEIYSSYIYHTSDSLGLVEHFKKYSQDMLSRYKPDEGSLIIDIGSNDGSLLGFFKEKNMKVLGIDPAIKIAREATSHGIPTIQGFFAKKLAEEINKEHGKAKIIMSNNTIANIDDLDGFIDGVRLLMDDESIFVFETGYVADLIGKILLDNIYHEHLSYFSVKPLREFFERKGMHLFDVCRIQPKGGSIRCMVQIKGGGRKESAEVNKLIKSEEKLKLHDEKTFRDFGAKIRSIRENLLATISGIRSKGGKIACYGASVGATTLLYNLSLEKDKIEFLVDDNTARQNLFSPGLGIKVLNPEAIYKKNIGYVIILAWQYSAPIMAKHQQFTGQNGHFIIPLPEVVIK